MQRLDHEYMMRSSEAPALKRLPSEYMRDMYYTTQPLERSNRKILQCTLEAFNAETQLLFSSDWPHWDFDPPSTITTLPFLSDQAKRNILGLQRVPAVQPRGQAHAASAKDVSVVRPGISETTDGSRSKDCPRRSI